MEVMHDDNDEKVTFTDINTDTRSFISGRCLHNYKFACVFVPCVIPLLYIAGNLLLGIGVFCLVCVYLVGHVSSQRKSTIAAFIISVVVLQFSVVYSLLPFIWKSVFNIGLVFIYNVFLVLSGGVGLLQSKQMQIEEPVFVMHLEYVLFLAYPITGQFVMLSISSLVLGWWTAPFSCILFGFLFVQVFIVPSQSSFVYHETVHRTGQQTPPNNDIIGPMEKTLLLFNLLSIPGSMFIIIYIMEFYKLITWVQLLCCGFVPVFLCTCLNIPDVILFLDLYPSTMTKVRYLSGIACLFLVWVLCWTSSLVSGHVLVLLPASALIGLVVGISAKLPDKKWVHRLSLLVSVILYISWLFMENVHTLSHQMVFLLLGLSTLSVLCAISILVMHSKSLFSVVMVLQSIGMVVCEFVLLEQSMYSIHWSLLTAAITFYIMLRLLIGDMVHWQSAWLCWSVHTSKLSLVIHLLVPQHAVTQGFLWPNILSQYRPFVCVIFSLFILKVLVFCEEKYITFRKGIQLCAVIGLAIVLVYDSLVLPVWIVLTNQWPTGADVAASVLLLWGVLCLRISLVQLSNNLDAKRLNIIVLCAGVFTELFQLNFSPSQVVSSVIYYGMSLVYPMELDELTEDISIHWMLLVSFITCLVLLVKLVRLEGCSGLYQLLVCLLIGLPVGFKIVSLLFPVHRPVFISLSYGLSSSLVLFLIMSSWINFGDHSTLLHRGYSFVGVVLLLLLSLFLESNTSRKPVPSRNPAGYSSLLYYMVLYLILGLFLKRQQLQTSQSLEDNKGKLSRVDVLLCSSSLANISVVMACLLATLYSPRQHWEIWISLCSSMLLLWRPDGLLWNIPSSFLASMFFVISMYIGTIMTAYPVRLAIFPVLGFLVEMLVLHCCLPSYCGLIYCLWKNDISMYLQQIVVFCGPVNVILLVYCSTICGRILGLIGILSTYWIFYYVQCSQ